MIYFLYGDNQFQIRRRLSELKDAFGKEYGTDNITKLDIAEMGWDKVANYLVGVSLFTQNEFLYLEEATNDSVVWRDLEGIISRIPDDKEVVLIDDSSTRTVKNLAQTRTFKAIKAAGKVEKYDQLKSYEIKRWLDEAARCAGIKLDAAASQRLMAATNGSDDQQNRLAMILKVLKFLPQPITAEQIDLYVEPDLETATFDIFKQIVQGNKSKVSVLLKRQTEHDVDPNQLIGILASQLINFVAVIAGANTKMHPFQRQQMQEMIRDMGGSQKALAWAKKVTKKLAATDAKMKRSSGEDASQYLVDAILFLA